MLASFPASMVNQRSGDLGIPNRFRLNSSRFKGCEASKKPGKTWFFPQVLDMGNPAVDKNEIDRSVADDLIGDMKVAAPRVSRFGNHHTYDEYRRVSAITLPCSDSVVWDHFQARGRQNCSSTWCRTSQKQIRTK